MAPIGTGSSIPSALLLPSYQPRILLIPILYLSSSSLSPSPLLSFTTPSSVARLTLSTFKVSLLPYLGSTSEKVWSQAPCRLHPHESYCQLCPSPCLCRHAEGAQEACVFSEDLFPSRRPAPPSATLPKWPEALTVTSSALHQGQSGCRKTEAQGRPCRAGLCTRPQTRPSYPPGVGSPQGS